MSSTTNHTSAIATTDTIHKDSVAAPFVPMYPKGYEDTLGNNIAIKEVSTFPVMEYPKGVAGEEYEGSYELRSGLMLFTIISLLLIAFSFRHGFKYFIQMIRNLFSTRTRENVFEDRTINETFFLTTLISNTCIVQGIMLYYALNYFGYISMWESRVILPVLICILFSGIYYTFQLLLYKALGYTFGTPDKTKIWIEGYNASQAILGILLIPIALMLDIHAGEIAPLLICGLTLYILLRILFICKGFRIFFNKIQLQVYFILYLCAIEIVPVILCFIGSIYICNIVQS